MVTYGVVKELLDNETSYRLEGIAFGLADGLIMSLGLIIGVAEATTDPRLVIIAGIMHAKHVFSIITFSLVHGQPRIL
jgi:hypothetical protein